MALRKAATAALALGSLLFGLGLMFSCGGREEPPAGGSAAPEGILRELESGSSITTDVNARAPAFARENSGGQVIRTQDFIGRNVLFLDFWSVFCQSCLEEIPFLTELHDRYHDEGLRIVSVNTDFFPQARIESFMKKTGMRLPFPLVLDRDQSLSRLFGVDALPVNILIDSSGWIRMVHLGFRPDDREMIESRVRKACRKIHETVVTLQPVEGQTAFAPPAADSGLLGPGAEVPDFSVLSRGDELLRFSELQRGSPAMVFFWSLFCQPCREEFPSLAELSARYGPRGLQTFAVNVDSGTLKPAALKFFRKAGGGIMPLFDLLPDGRAGEVSRSLGVRSTPSLFLLSAEGTVLLSASGGVAPGELAGRIDSILPASGATEATVRGAAGQ